MTPDLSVSPTQFEENDQRDHQETTWMDESLRERTPSPLPSLPNQKFTTHVKAWSHVEIASFLDLYQCGQYTSLFRKNNIDGKVLLDLDMTSLREIGISKIGDRVKLLRGLRELRSRAIINAPPSVATALAIVPPVDGRTPPPDLDPAVSQVPRRLASAIVSKRLQLSRPPPLNLLFPNVLPSTGSEQSARSPSLQSATPKSLRPQHFSKTVNPSSITDYDKLSSNEYGRPPTNISRYRVPSPSNESTNSSTSHLNDVAYSAIAEQASHENVVNMANENIMKYPEAASRICPKTSGPSVFSINTTGATDVHHPYATIPRTGLASDHNNVYAPNPFQAYTNIDKARILVGLRSSADSNASFPPKGLDSFSRSSQPMSLDDLRRHLVKFVNADDGTTRTVNVSSCMSGVEVLERVLKKFGKRKSGDLSIRSKNGVAERGGLDVDGWGIFVPDNDGEDCEPLSDAALLDICHGRRHSGWAPLHETTVLYEKGLLLKKIPIFHTRKDQVVRLGYDPSPASPYNNELTRLNFGELEDVRGVENLNISFQDGRSKQTNRASTISILSGLGVTGGEPFSTSYASQSPLPAETSTRTKKMYNFFGHRPPSELISNHLAEYFPSARKRDLVKTARQSMLRVSHFGSTGIDDVQMGFPSLLNVANEAVNPSQRKGRPQSTRTVSSSTAHTTIPEEAEPPNVIQNSGNDITKTDDLAAFPVGKHPPLLPPFVSTGESLVESLQAYSPAPSTFRVTTRFGRRSSTGSTISRLSVLSSARRSKDKSDMASLLTVDEITAEVERRTSTDDIRDWETSYTPADNDFLPRTGSDGYLSQSEDDDNEDQTDSDVTTDDDVSAPGRAFTSTGSKRNIKWIKGALIGSGSFGSVYLGMDAQSGLLMAVKQVDLSSGDARNEDKKRNMVQALEREIELLKELQHDNIVQYLGMADSSADGNNLNIFLEYVPGGSVAALLNNYGAFEEALVRNFVRQILMGLNYLHEREIIHRDIKGANILVDNKGGIKISDFGISKKVENSLITGMRINRPSLQGSVFWMAPEVVKQTSYTSKADIWSVGCLVVEMLTGTHPWAELTQMQAIFRIGSQARPATPSDISSEAGDFLHQTFEVNHDHRPPAFALLDHPFISVQPTIEGSMSMKHAETALKVVDAARNRLEHVLPSLGGLGKSTGDVGSN